MPQEYNVSEMKVMSENYAQRVLDASNATSSNVNLKKEYLIIDIDKDTIDKLVNAKKYNGAFGILALEEDGGYNRQSIILVPHDDKGKAVPFKGETGIKGIERFFTVPPKLQGVIYPAAAGVEDIPGGVDAAFNSLGIL